MLYEVQKKENTLSGLDSALFRGCVFYILTINPYRKTSPWDGEKKDLGEVRSIVALTK
jgi:hypothetical protein